jgi:Arylsulfotransferase (ASST)
MGRAVFLIVSLASLFFSDLQAQTIPADGAELNYRVVGFSVPFVKGASGFDLEIARGTISKEDSFKKNIIKTLACGGDRVVAEVPEFGAAYTWRVKYANGGAKKVTSKFFHFSTGVIPDVDTSKFRLRIISEAAAYKDAYVFIDGSRAMYDMTGKPVWYMPAIEGQVIYANDIKPSGKGTITFIKDDDFEIGYNGELLWKTPGKAGSVEGPCHHDFCRMSGGHYLVLRKEVSDNQPPVRGQEMTEEKIIEEKRKRMFSKLVEYDSYNNVVWEWKSSDYYKTSDLAKYTFPTRGDIKSQDLHENAFYFDERSKVIYLSYKNINRVIKIKYPEGNVLATYGQLYDGNGQAYGGELFCGQHSVSRSADGYMFLFNNNTCRNGYPLVEKLRESDTGTVMPQIVWQYECNNDQPVTPGGFPSGGHVIEMPDHSLFIATAGPDSKLFIVNMNKEILWSAVAEKKEGDQWVPNTHYRASIVPGRKELEKIIWHTVADKMAAADNVPEQNIVQDAAPAHQSGTR